MNDRRIATLVGVLYIIGTAAGIGSKIVSAPLGQSPDHLAALAANPTPAMLTALLVLTMGIALAIIPALLYPIIKRRSEILAVGYVIFRGAIEMLLYIGWALCWLILVLVAREAAGSSAAAASGFTSLATLVMKVQDPIGAIAAMMFALGGLMLYGVLYAARLVPRWLAGWGFVGAVLYFAAGLTFVFSAEPTALYMPLGLQEMVMAVWLIVKGFESTAPALRMQPVAA